MCCVKQTSRHDPNAFATVAQVVSGIGFLGAGIIYRDGLNVQGLNTAATLWCSEGGGLLAGIGAWPFALLLAGMVVFVNLGLRPLVRFLKRHTKARVPLTRSYRVILSCALDQEAAMRALSLRRLSLGGLHVHEIAVQAQEAGLDISALVGVGRRWSALVGVGRRWSALVGVGRRWSALVGGEDASDHAVEQAVHRVAAEAGVVRVRWMVADEV